MKIEWTEDQPFMRPVKKQIEESGLISDLAELADKYASAEVKAVTSKTGYKGESLYGCSVYTTPYSENYQISIRHMPSGLTGSKGNTSIKCQPSAIEITEENIRNNLIPDLIKLSKKHDMINIEIITAGKKGREHAYVCSVLAKPSLESYIVMIQQRDDTNNTIVEEIPK